MSKPSDREITAIDQRVTVNIEEFTNFVNAYSLSGDHEKRWSIISFLNTEIASFIWSFTQRGLTSSGSTRGSDTPDYVAQHSCIQPFGSVAYGIYLPWASDMDVALTDPFFTTSDPEISLNALMNHFLSTCGDALARDIRVVDKARIPFIEVVIRPSEYLLRRITPRHSSLSRTRFWSVPTASGVAGMSPNVRREFASGSATSVTTEVQGSPIVVTRQVGPSPHLRSESSPAQDGQASVSSALSGSDSCRLCGLGFRTLCPSHAPVAVQLSVLNGSHRGLATTAWVRSAASDMPCMRSILLVLKHILTSAGLNNAFAGGLSSHSVIVMLVAFLRHFHPHDHHVMPKGTILLQFLAWYGGVTDSYHGLRTNVMLLGNHHQSGQYGGVSQYGAASHGAGTSSQGSPRPSEFASAVGVTGGVGQGVIGGAGSLGSVASPSVRSARNEFSTGAGSFDGSAQGHLGGVSINSPGQTYTGHSQGGIMPGHGGNMTGHMSGNPQGHVVMGSPASAPQVHPFETHTYFDPARLCVHMMGDANCFRERQPFECNDLVYIIDPTEVGPMPMNAARSFWRYADLRKEFITAYWHIVSNRWYSAMGAASPPVCGDQPRNSVDNERAQAASTIHSGLSHYVKEEVASSSQGVRQGTKRNERHLGGPTSGRDPLPSSHGPLPSSHDHLPSSHESSTSRKEGSGAHLGHLENGSLERGEHRGSPSHRDGLPVENLSDDRHVYHSATSPASRPNQGTPVLAPSESRGARSSPSPDMKSSGSDSHGPHGDKPGDQWTLCDAPSSPHLARPSSPTSQFSSPRRDTKADTAPFFDCLPECQRENGSVCPGGPKCPAASERQ